MSKLLVLALLSLMSGTTWAQCATKTVTDRLSDANGAVIVTEKSRTSCGDAGSNVKQVEGIDDHCYYVPSEDGQESLACQWPSGRWEIIGDVNTIDLFTGPNQSSSSKRSVTQDYIRGNESLAALVSNVIRWSAGKLDEESKRLHNTAIFVTLERAKNGEIVSWKNPKQNTSGKIKVVKTISHGEGFCRYMMMQIVKDDTPRELKETACYNNNNGKWYFYN